MLATDGDSTNIAYHALAEDFPIHTVIIEGKESKKIFLRRRIKKLGYFIVFGQVLFQVIAVKILRLFSRGRIAEIISQNNLHELPIPETKIVRVNSVNEARVKILLETLRPDVVIVNGTRIISKKLLEALPCPFINMHTGITPMYRGVHGGYWALVNKDAAHCGVTVHLVDAGIDTGNVLFQHVIDPGKKDNFITYPYLQTAAGVTLLKAATAAALRQELVAVPTQGPSALWYHPTLWQYLYNRVVKGVK